MAYDWATLECVAACAHGLADVLGEHADAAARIEISALEAAEDLRTKRSGGRSSANPI